MAKHKPITIGATYTMLTAIRRIGGPGLKHYEFSCSCGVRKIYPGSWVARGETTSCGCLGLEQNAAKHRTHGMTFTTEYKVWRAMKGRCLRKSNKQYADYGGRGITVCERWLKFENFFADMGKRPEGLTLDRLDNNGNYEPGNCRWRDMTEQSNNKRNNRVLSFNGERMSVSMWAKKLGSKADTIRHRLSFGWSVERALTTAPRRYFRKSL